MISRIIAVGILSSATALAVAQAPTAQSKPQSKPKTTGSAPAKSAAKKPAATARKAVKPAVAPVTTPSGLQYWDLRKGTGAEAVAGKTALVTYKGTFTSGKMFDASLDPKKPFKFTIGAGQVIKGWDEGVAGMKVGGRRRLRVPPDLAYGPKGYPGVIPPNSTLVFEVGLVGVK